MKRRNSDFTRNRNSGFTLLEVLIAIAIFSTLATMVYGALNAVVSKNDAIKGGVEIYGMANSCLNRISLDLTSVYVTQYPEYKPPASDDPPDPYRFQGEEEMSGSGSFPNLRFTSTAHLPMGSEPVPAHLAEIRYYVVKSEDSESEYLLKRADTPFPYDITEKWDADKADDPILCEGIESLKFTYFDDEANLYETWDSESENTKYATPRSVAVEMTIKTKSGSHRFTTRIDIPVYREKVEDVPQ